MLARRFIAGVGFAQSVGSYMHIAQPEALCSNNNRNVLLRLVHVPKSGGSSLQCTFDPTKLKWGACSKPRAAPGTTLNFQGNHENYQEIIDEYYRGCKGGVYER